MGVFLLLEGVTRLIAGVQDLAFLMISFMYCTSPKAAFGPPVPFFELYRDSMVLFWDFTASNPAEDIKSPLARSFLASALLLIYLADLYSTVPLA